MPYYSHVYLSFVTCIAFYRNLKMQKDDGESLLLNASLHLPFAFLILLSHCPVAGSARRARSVIVVGVPF